MFARNRMTTITFSTEYSQLKYPLVVFSLAMTTLSLISFLSYTSNYWFTYETVEESHRPLDEDSENEHIFRVLEYGSIGLWSICSKVTHQGNNFTCLDWTPLNKPSNFGAIVIMLSIILLIVNLTILPSWSTTILLIYNRRNRYLYYIEILIWMLFIISSVLLCFFIAILILIGLTRFYTPGSFRYDKKSLAFQTGPGIVWTTIAGSLALLCFLCMAVVLVWKKMIEIELIQSEKELIRLLEDEPARFNWNPALRIPRPLSQATDDEFLPPPPPYESRD